MSFCPFLPSWPNSFTPIDLLDYGKSLQLHGNQVKAYKLNYVIECNSFCSIFPTLLRTDILPHPLSDMKGFYAVEDFTREILIRKLLEKTSQSRNAVKIFQHTSLGNQKMQFFSKDSKNGLMKETGLRTFLAIGQACFDYASATSLTSD